MQVRGNWMNRTKFCAYFLNSYKVFRWKDAYTSVLIWDWQDKFYHYQSIVWQIKAIIILYFLKVTFLHVMNNILSWALLLSVCRYWKMVAFKKYSLLKELCLSSQSTKGGAYNLLGRRNNILNNNWVINLWFNVSFFSPLRYIWWPSRKFALGNHTYLVP